MLQHDYPFLRNLRNIPNEADQKGRGDYVDIDAFQEFSEDENLKVFAVRRKICDRITRFDSAQESSKTRILRNHALALDSGGKGGPETEIVISHERGGL